MYTLYGIPFGPGADPDLAFFTFSFTSFHVGYVVSISISGALTGSMRGHYPKELSLCLSLCVCWRCDSMSSMLQSGLPDFSPSSSDLVNLNGFAVKEALILAFAFLFSLMFSSFLRFVRCSLSMSLKCWRPIFPMLYCFRRTLSHLFYLS